MGSPFVLYYTVSVSKSRRFEEYVSGYDYSTVPPTEIIQNDVVIPEMILSGDANSYTATGLEPDTSYYFRFTACNAAGCASVILGPYRTAKEALDDEGRVTASYRQDPITGLVRIWWEQSSVPDRTIITLTPISAFGGTYSFEEYEKTYTVQSIVRGVYTVLVRNYIGNTVVASDTFEMTVNDYRICDAQDGCGETDALSAATATVHVESDEPITLFDSAAGILPPVVRAEILDGGFLFDEAAHQGTFSVVFEAESLFALSDQMGNLQNDVVLLSVESEAFLFDTFPPLSSAVALFEVEDAHRFFDTVGIRHQTAQIFATDATLFGEGTRLSVSVMASPVERVPFADRSELALSVNVETTEPWRLRDTPVFPDQNALRVAESLRVRDLGDESRVGQFYDFSHVRGRDE